MSESVAKWKRWLERKRIRKQWTQNEMNRKMTGTKEEIT